MSHNQNPSRIPLPTNWHSISRAGSASPPSPGSFTPQQVAPSNRPSMQYLPPTPRISSFGSTLRGLTRNTNTQSTAEASSHAPTSTLAVRERDHAGQGLTTFRDLQGAEVSGGVFLNAAGPVTIHHGVASTTESEPLRQPPDNDDAEAINVNIHPTQNSSPTATSVSLEHSEYEIYSKYLSVKQRGLPLWEPGPRMMFPIEYRKNGVSIGDVGILDSTTGYFAFLFNIFHPANHKINEGRVPDGFAPLDWSKAQRSITKGILYDHGSCLASSSLQRTESSDFSFQTTGREGAVLVMPTGAISDDLGNHKLVAKYIAANAKSWWEYIDSDDCGVQNENVIQVVVGTDKVSAWGMATFENVEEPQQFELRNDGTGPQGRYRWKKINSGRAGPSEEEIQELSHLSTMPLRNQCVFVRTLNVSVSSEVREPSAVHVCSGCPAGGCVPDSSSPGQRTVNIQTSKRGQPIPHPAKPLHERLLEKSPNADVVITSDSVWMSVIRKEDTTMPSVEDICTRVLDSYVICQKKGFITLEKREDPYVIGRLFLEAPAQFVKATSDTTSWASQRGGGSRCSTASSTAYVPWAAPSLVDLASYWDVDSPSSGTHINWPSLSELPRRRQFGRPERYLRQDSFPGIHHSDNQDRLSFDRASKTSTQSSSSKTRVSGLRSRYSVATSITTLLSRRSRASVPRRDLELPGGPSQSPKKAKSASKGTLWRKLQTLSPSVYINAPQHSHSGGKFTTSSALDWDQGLLQLTAKSSLQSKPAHNDFLQYLSPIEQAVQSRLSTFHVVGGAVTSGTLEGLVQFLITGFGLPGHTHYRDAFVTACSELTTPETLFRILSRRLSEEQHASDEGSGTQYTIFVFIVYWLKSNRFSPSEKLLYRIKSFCEEAFRQHPALCSIARETQQLIDSKMAQSTALQAPNPAEPIILDASITPRDLAIALCLLEGDRYKALGPSDYLQHLSKGQSDKVKIYNETNEKIKLWVIRSILHYDTVSSRSQLVKFYITTAFECYSMRNLSSTIAISAALQSISVESLKATMKATKKALSKKMQAKLPILSEIIDPISGHRGYYNALQSGATVQDRDTCIPWLPVHLKELDKVVRQPTTVLVDDQHLVNFTRYNKFMGRINEILHYLPPDLEDKRHGGQLTYLLNQLRDIDLSGGLEQQLLTRGEELSVQESSVNVYYEHLRRVGFAV